MAITESEEQKEKRLKETEQNLKDLQNLIKQTNVYALWKSQEEKRERENDIKEYQN